MAWIAAQSIQKLDPGGLVKVKAGSTMKCRVASSPDSNLDLGLDIINYLNTLTFSDCAQYHVDSGYMIHKNGFSWSCLTTSGSAQDIFC